MEIAPPEFNPVEMTMYGLDPASEKDRQEWIDTAPSSSEGPSQDYSDDVFEFGSNQSNET
jgi:hypothetical protein